MNSLGIRSAGARQQAREAKHLRYGDTLWARKHRVILREHLGAFATPSPSLAAVLTRCGVGALPGEVGAFTEQFTPRLPDGVWDRIGSFVRDSVVLASPQTAYSVEILLTAAAHYVAWCLNQGWPLEAETIWSRQAIDLYVTDQYSHLAEGTRRNYRARLMRVSEVVLPEEHGEKMTALNRKSTAAPYSAGQMVRHREWAAAQTSPFKRYRAMLMLVLAAGAGLKANEIADLPADHVQPTPDGGYLITVAGSGVAAHGAAAGGVGRVDDGRIGERARRPHRAVGATEPHPRQRGPVLVHPVHDWGCSPR